VNLAYWAVIAAGVYVAFEYLLPVSVPFIIGVLIAIPVVWFSRLIRCPRKIVRSLLTLLIYGLLGTLVGLLAVKGVDLVTNVILWISVVYRTKLLPMLDMAYEWMATTVNMLDPTLISVLDSLSQSLVSGLETLVGKLSGVAMNLVSGVAKGVPSLILSLLAMIFCTVFVANDYEKIQNFYSHHTPEKVSNIIKQVRQYLTGTLLVVIRSYALIMLLTFTELSILFSIFGISNAVLKASIIAVLDILPILGTGGIMIPWSVISFALGNTAMGIKLLVIYAIVTVVRNYVEPKIVGAQLGLHPIITLVSMFVGLRIFGFWGLFGLPVGISFLWKRYQEKNAVVPEATA
jgi:sporulation integral membrane protein YtvI